MSISTQDYPLIIAFGKSLRDSEIINKLRDKKIELFEVNSPQLMSSKDICAIILDKDLLSQFPLETWRQYQRNGFLLAPLSLSKNADILLDETVDSPLSISCIESACKLWSLKKLNQDLSIESKKTKNSLEKMAEIGIALSAQTDLSKLLRMVLDKAQSLACCDAVSLYLVDKSNTENPKLVFKLTNNDSIDFAFEEQSFDLNDQSISGYVATHNIELNIEDVYQVPPQSPYKFNYDFDQNTGYRCVSLLAIPICNHRNNVIGALQFINRKKTHDIKLYSPEIALKEAIPFTEEICVLLRALASQAAIAIEKNVLIDSISQLFEGFVHASVAAIEQRDPTTSGHSFRVADLSIKLAESIPHSQHSQFKHLVFTEKDLRELRYAALLHDFGKVGVRENILTKAKKIYTSEINEITLKINLIKEQLKSSTLQKIVDNLKKTGNNSYNHDQLFDNLQQESQKLDLFLAQVLQANEPTLLPEEACDYLREIRDYQFHCPIEGQSSGIISDTQFQSLSIAKGSLSTTERREIESHVTHTVNFLNLIPWTPELSNIPNIAAAHHEKLDGSGYPNRLKKDEIPIASKIMTICDIYDALTASDRPYKPAAPNELAFKILSEEAKSGLLDPTMVQVFIESESYKVIENKSYPKSRNFSMPVYHHHVCDFDLHRGSLH